MVHIWKLRYTLSYFSYFLRLQIGVNLGGKVLQIIQLGRRNFAAFHLPQLFFAFYLHKEFFKQMVKRALIQVVGRLLHILRKLKTFFCSSIRAPLLLPRRNSGIHLAFEPRTFTRREPISKVRSVPSIKALGFKCLLSLSARLISAYYFSVLAAKNIEVVCVFILFRGLLELQIQQKMSLGVLLV